MSSGLWETSKLFFKADKPGQRELRTVLRAAVLGGMMDLDEATFLTWLWLVEMHGGDEQ